MKSDNDLISASLVSFFPFWCLFSPARKGGCKGFIYTGAFNDLKGATATL